MKRAMYAGQRYDKDWIAGHPQGLIDVDSRRGIGKKQL